MSLFPIQWWTLGLYPFDFIAPSRPLSVDTFGGKLLEMLDIW